MVVFKNPDNLMFKSIKLKHQIASRFNNPLDCLSAHLIFESSEVLAKTKPANLIPLVNRDTSCGKNLYELWHRHHNELSQRLDGLQFLVLKNSAKSVLILCYDNVLLSEHLSHPGIMALLSKAGYSSPASSDLLLEELLKKMGQTCHFPHEIGLFIGYPAKDVAAFMGVIKIPFTCQGPWKIFGNPLESLKLVNRNKNSRIKIGKRLAECKSPFECLLQVKKLSFL